MGRHISDPQEVAQGLSTGPGAAELPSRARDAAFSWHAALHGSLYDGYATTVGHGSLGKQLALRWLPCIAPLRKEGEKEGQERQEGLVHYASPTCLLGVFREEKKEKKKKKEKGSNSPKPKKRKIDDDDF